MSEATPLQRALIDAAANDAFEVYSEARARSDQTGALVDVLASRTAYRRFLQLYLTPDELAGMEARPLRVRVHA